LVLSLFSDTILTYKLYNAEYQDDCEKLIANDMEGKGHGLL